MGREELFSGDLENQGSGAWVCSSRHILALNLDKGWGERQWGRPRNCLLGWMFGSWLLAFVFCSFNKQKCTYLECTLDLLNQGLLWAGPRPMCLHKLLITEEINTVGSWARYSASIFVLPSKYFFQTLMALFYPSLNFLFPLLLFHFLFWEREREREISICCSTYLCILWLLLVCALTRDQTPIHGVWGRCSTIWPTQPGLIGS